MKRPQTHIPKRPRASNGRSARSAKEAAISLVRIEFDVSRLSLGIDQADARVRAYRAELEDKLKERRRLIDLIQR